MAVTIAALPATGRNSCAGRAFPRRHPDEPARAVLGRCSTLQASTGGRTAEVPEQQDRPQPTAARGSAVVHVGRRSGALGGVPPGSSSPTTTSARIWPSPPRIGHCRAPITAFPARSSPITRICRRATPATAGRELAEVGADYVLTCRPYDTVLLGHPTWQGTLVADLAAGRVAAVPRARAARQRAALPDVARRRARLPTA